MEQWKPIEGYEGLYEVSNLGQVRSFYSGEAKILKPGKQRIGYLRVNLYKNGKRYTKQVHRLVATAFIPNIGDKPQVNHIDGDKTNNKVDNLEWVTGKENNQHAWETGLHVITEETRKKMSKSLKGENNPMYGKHHTEETRKKMSKALKGENHPMYGKHHTKETKRKLSKAHKGKYAGEKNPRAKRVICITTGETFDYIGEAQEKYNIDYRNISACCRGKQKSAGKLPTGEKLVWEYSKEQTKN